MTFTDFVSSITDRALIAAGLSQFMFVIMTLNIVICLFAVILWAYEKYRPTLFSKSPAIVAVTPTAIVTTNLNGEKVKESLNDITVDNLDVTLQNIADHPQEKEDIYSTVILKVKPKMYDDENGELRPISVLQQHLQNDSNFN
jgi:hypothetical protein